MSTAIYLAVLDLGSNSFRLAISRVQGEQIETVEYQKEAVRLGNALSPAGELSAEGIARGLACLERFAAKMRLYPLIHVRAVTTQTLREATNPRAFLDPAHQLLGVPVEVISGAEEARLIYAGVLRYLPPTPDTRLVIDIGGRSTEVIVGQGKSAHLTHSYPLGCVSYSDTYFDVSQVTAAHFERAISAAKSLLAPLPLALAPYQRTQIYGCSGTAGALSTLLRSQQQGPHIQLAGLHHLRELFIKAGALQELRLKGLKENRKPVILGGLAILIALFELLALTQMQASQGALRDGVLHEWLGKRTLH